MAVEKKTKHLLMLVHRIPYPPDKGDKIRSFHEFRFLREKGWHIHLCTFIDDPNDVLHVEALRSQCVTSSFHRLRKVFQKISMALALFQRKPLSVGAFYTNRALQYVHKVFSEYPIRAVLCFSSPMAEYLFRSSDLKSHSGLNHELSARNFKLRTSQNPGPGTRNPRLIMDLIDVDSDKWQQYAGKCGRLRRWIYMLESRRLALYEKRIVDAFDATTVVSDAEAHLLRQKTGGGEKVHAMSNGVDTSYFHPASERITDKDRESFCTLVFCGLMDYHPNVDAVIWFVREVLAKARDRLGEVNFHIVGARPVKEVLNLAAEPGVKVLGRVEDVRPYVWKAAISVAPIRIARGIQNKVLEAMAMGKPVVATEQAFEGIDALPGQDLLVTEDDPDAFAEGVASLWNDMNFATQMGLNAREAVVQRYSWENKLEKLDALLQ